MKTYKRINEPYYFRELIRMQNDDEVYLAEGWAGYKHAIKFLDKHEWEIDGFKYVKRYCFETKRTAISTERAIDKLRREIDLKSLKRGTLENSCIENELYLMGDYGFYYNGFGLWYFGKYEEIIIEHRELCHFTFEVEVWEEIKYRMLNRELLTNQNYEILLGRHEK